jgi:hypothetical protein
MKYLTAAEVPDKRCKKGSTKKFNLKTTRKINVT